MRIVWLFECTDPLGGGNKVALDQANWLAAHGHDVTVLGHTGPSDPLPGGCAFQTVPALTADHVPPADVVVATAWTTLPCAAALARAGTVAVQLCQAYEGDRVADPAARRQIEAAYRLPGVHRVGATEPVTARLRELFGAGVDATPAADGEALLRVLERLRPPPTAWPAPAGITASPLGHELVDLAARITGELRAGAARLLQLGDHQRAAAFFAAARCLCPGDTDLALESAWSLHLAGDSARALQLLDALLHEGVDSADLHERRALLLDGLGRPDAAAQALRAAIAAGRRSAQLYNSLGVALYRCGDRVGARHSFERALVLDPQHQDALDNHRELATGS